MSRFDEHLSLLREVVKYHSRAKSQVAWVLLHLQHLEGDLTTLGDKIRLPLRLSFEAYLEDLRYGATRIAQSLQAQIQDDPRMMEGSN
jgi:hypothetical protein